MSSFLSDIAAFGNAVYEQRQWLLGGSLAIWLITEAINAIWRRWQKPTSKKPAPIARKWVIAGILVLASFLAWQVEHRRVQEMEAQRPYFTHQNSRLSEVQAPSGQIVALRRSRTVNADP